MECKDDWMPDIDPEEAYWKFREHFGATADAAFDTYCPDGVCVADATSDFIVDNDVSGKVNDLLDDEEAKGVIITTLEDIEENYDIDTSAAQMLLELEDAAEVSWVLDQALAEAQENTEDEILHDIFGGFREGLTNLQLTRKSVRNHNRH